MRRVRSRARARATRVLTAAAASVLLAGCVQMPTSGPVVESEVTTGADDVPGISFNPRPPQEGQAAADIVKGFFDAMRATPVRTSVARQFLSREAAEAWVPERQIITYAESAEPTTGTSVRVRLSDVKRYDARGAWQRTQPSADLSLRLVEEDGEWRIDEVPDALIVPDSWFDDWYEPASLYYFDPATEVLVPEPVFAPRGDQFASSLVRGLLATLPEDLQDVARSYFPPGTTHGLSVPITSGIAEVSLSGDPDAVDEVTAQRMLAQLVWTLRQEPRINAVQLTIGGRVISFQGGSTQVDLGGVGSAYDPNGEATSTELYALADGLVVAGSMAGFEETLGPLGQDDYGLRSIGVDLAGSRVAGVSADGTRLVVAPAEAPTGEVTPVVVGAADLAAPRWDHRDRIWVLDRNAGRARVVLVVDGSAAEVDVPGLSGRRVTQLLVSRDGTRLLGVRRGRKADQVVSVRVRQDEAGVVVGFTPVRRLPLPVEGNGRIRDVGWRSPTTVSVLSDINEELSLVRTLSVDGAPGEVSTDGTVRLRGSNRVLVSTPADAESYALAGRSVTSLTRPERTVSDLPDGLTSLTYVG
ncbi:LpqB family beta-propeller domain-containing protein [Nocardioides xinjiangensis]|uniref:LpqB family beta-propeller domain-containing protein n=1 Tax=Nocardioides xinjiangensis TaxID=2817376 RepID=UPI001B3094C7|nr:LpqB family beta-propeller domain-containing protein [Nocardioides sp. SYSU D00778]